MNGFFTLETGLRAIRAQLMASRVIGHNIANSRTPGYSRQIAELQPSTPLQFSTGQHALSLGTGVTVAGIRRQREEFLDRLARFHLSDLARWETLRPALDLVEIAFGEPAGFGPRQACLRLWDALQELSGEPESGTLRHSACQEAESLATTLGSLARHLDEQVQQQVAAAQDTVAEVNHLAGQIAVLNHDLRLAAILKTQPGDLEDRLDLLLDRLSSLAGATSRREGDGTVSVHIGAAVLVERDSVSPLILEITGGQLRFAGAGGSEVVPPSGVLAARRDSHNQILPGYQDSLDTFARQLAGNLNSIHQAGYGLDGSTGLDLYRYDPAAPARTLALAPEVAADPARLAASADGAVGDGYGALSLARALTGPNFTGQSAAEYWASAATRLGMELEKVGRQVENATLLAEQAENLRAQIMGVSLDEETVDLVRCQHAYAAAARLISVADEMLEILIARTGRVGR
ncbi:MAG: flagellar hook-associated protein FlgK [bacterium]|nr:flagellar hook-associated protein FlgK [bacterium]